MGVNNTFMMRKSQEGTKQQKQRRKIELVIKQPGIARAFTGGLCMVTIATPSLPTSMVTREFAISNSTICRYNFQKSITKIKKYTLIKGKSLYIDIDTKNQ